MKRGVRVAHLEQEPVLADLPVLEAVLASEASPALRLAARYAAATEAGDAALVASLSSEMDRLDGWSVEAEVRTVLQKLGCSSFLDRPTSQLSGGQRKRVALAACLLSNPDVLLLDEPTNHLSMEGVEWLEAALRGSSTTLLLVSHDRVFLDSVCTHMLELDGNGGSFRHAGGYSAFISGREARYAAQAQAAGNAAGLLVKEAAWMARQPQGRQAKQQARQDAFYELEAKAKGGAARMGVLELETAAAVVRLGNTLVELKGVSLRAPGGGPQILRNFSYTFQPGERLGIVGPNGVGKSTFLKVISGALKVDSGTVVRGETVQMGVYEQQHEWAHPQQRVVDYVSQLAAEAREREEERVAAGGRANAQDSWNARSLMERFQFTSGRQATPICELSGGERRRLQLMTVLAQQPNFIAFDEPTNDLDLDSIESLEAMLKTYQGIFIVVGHDRAFMEQCTRLLVFEGDGKTRSFSGTYSELRAEQAALAAPAAAAPAASAQSAAPPVVQDKEARRRASNALKKIPKVEADVERCEAELAELDAQLVAAGADAGRAAALAATREEAQARLDGLMEEYERLMMAAS